MDFANVVSPINFSSFYSPVLQADLDPLCNNRLVSLFVQFAGDYFYSCNFSQDPRDPRYPGQESAWSTIVRSFVDSPVSIRYLRDLTEVFQACSGSSAEVPPFTCIPPQVSRSDNLMSPRTQANASPDKQDKVSHLRAMSSFSVPSPTFQDSHASYFSSQQHEWLPETNQDQPMESRTQRSARTKMCFSKQEGIEKKKGKVVLCAGQNCNKQPSYNWPGQKLRRFCAEHRSPGMVHTGRRQCFQEGCMKRALFNFQGQGTRFCNNHKAEGMVNVLPGRICEYPDCSTYPSFNFPGTNTAKFCGNHRMEGMVGPKERGNKDEVLKSICEVEGCNLQPFFNFEGMNAPQYCSVHKQEGMVIVGRSKKQACEQEQCFKAARYNFPGQKKKRFCEFHKQPGMIFVINIPCEAENCNTRPRFNMKGERKARFCGRHKLNGMVDVTLARLGFCSSSDCGRPGLYKFGNDENTLYCLAHRQDGMIFIKHCKQQGCEERPLFNDIGKSIPFFCGLHKKKDMVQTDRNLTKCQYSSCTEKPMYNFTTFKLPEFCEAHKSEGMVEVLAADARVRKATCQAEGCKLQPFFNFEGTYVPKYCAGHSQEGMVFNGRWLCEHEHCSKTSRYSFPGEKKKRFCETHKQPGMIYVTNTPCEAENCNTRPRFNIKGERKGRFCGNHKLDGMVDVTLAVLGFCSTADCDRPGLYKFRGEEKAVFCLAHRQNGMVSIRGCRQRHCKEEPLFNFLGKKTAVFCAAHKKKDMVQIGENNRKCQYPNASCTKNALYNSVYLKQPKFCEDHRSEGMVEISATPYCIIVGCRLFSTYAYAENAGTPKHCRKHKLEGMVRIGKCCSHPDCEKIPVFNFKGERFGKFCVAHKEPNMVRVVGALQCAQEECGELKAPFYFSNDTRKRFCNVHKQEGMVRGRQRRCQNTSCKKIPSFFFKGRKSKGLFCSDHKSDGMVRLSGKKICSKSNCIKRAVFNFDGQKEGELFCSGHKLLGMVDVTGPKCENEGCWRLALYNFKGEISKKFCILHRAENMVPVLKAFCNECDAPVLSTSSNNSGVVTLCSVHQQGMLLI